MLDGPGHGAAPNDAERRRNRRSLNGAIRLQVPKTVAWGSQRSPPPLRSGNEMDTDPHGRPRRREWLGSRMVAVLVMALGTTMLLAGTDVAIIATLEKAGQVSWAALVVAVYGVASIVGGLVYGALSRPLPTSLLLGLLGLATIPAGLAHTWPWLCVAGVGSGVLTAPTLSTVADAVSRLAPASVRGEATGLQSSALSAGFALGSPIVGVSIDASVPGAGFAAAGLAGGAADMCCPVARWRKRSLRPEISAATRHRTLIRVRPAPSLAHEVMGSSSTVGRPRSWPVHTRAGGCDGLPGRLVMMLVVAAITTPWKVGRGR